MDGLSLMAEIFLGEISTEAQSKMLQQMSDITMLNLLLNLRMCFLLCCSSTSGGKEVQEESFEMYHCLPIQPFK